MDQRAEAIRILQQARDHLVARLLDRVISSEEEILDDAQGASYLSEIESVYEQVGARLHHVNTMLGSIPAPEEKKPPREDLPDGSVFQADTSGRSHLHTPPAPTTQALPPPASFENFGRQIAGGDLDTAGRTLAELFELSEDRGRQCAQRFAEGMRSSPEFLNTAKSLRRQLEVGSVNDILMLLFECFGLQGTEALGVMIALKARIQTGSSLLDHNAQ